MKAGRLTLRLHCGRHGAGACLSAVPSSNAALRGPQPTWNLIQSMASTQAACGAQGMRASLSTERVSTWRSAPLTLHGLLAYGQGCRKRFTFLHPCCRRDWDNKGKALGLALHPPSTG